MAIAQELPEVERQNPYQEWQAREEVPFVRGLLVEDLNSVELGTWRRKGGLGAFIDLGTHPGHERGSYLFEIAPGGSLKPQRHFYEEITYVVRGRGATTVWNEGYPKQTVEWQEGSLLAIPLNAWHQHFNGDGSQPARLFSYTNAPAMMGLFHNDRFIFANPFIFDDRFTGNEDYYSGNGKLYNRRIWETNFVADVRSFKLQEWRERGAGGTNIMLDMDDGTLACHISEFPVGTYKKAHVHSRGVDKGGGANLLILDGEGFTLVWRPEENTRQHLRWKRNSLVVAPSSWFHQHFNAGARPARYLAFRGGSTARHWMGRVNLNDVNEKLGGTQIEYEDEDPEIHRIFEGELARSGATCFMQGMVAGCTGKARSERSR